MTLPARRTRDGDPTDLGRPLTLTSDLAQEIAVLLRRGLTQTDACAAVGLARSTFYDWLARGRDLAAKDPADMTIEELRLSDFSDAVTRARARAKGDALGMIRAAMATDWRAAAWFLERSFPEEYGPRAQVEVSTGDSDVVRIRWPEDPIEVEDAELVDEDE